PEITSMITSVGQSSDGMVATLAPAYKAEIMVKLVDKEKREDATDVYAAKTKRELQKILVGAKIKTLPVSFIGTADQAPIELVVMGSDRDSVTAYAEKALAELKKIPGAVEAKLSAESGNPEISV